MAKNSSRIVPGLGITTPHSLYWSGYDYTKYFLSILVIIIHTEPFGNWIHPLLSVAVPMFFIISSYFFFNGCNNDHTDIPKIKKYVKRNSYLYLFWFVLLLPITLEMRNYFESGLIAGIFRIVRGVFFGSTFKVSWFISGSVISIILLYFLQRYIKTSIIFFAAILFYILCCITSSYYYLFTDSWLISADKVYRSLLGEPHHSFLIAFCWLSVGWYFTWKKMTQRGVVGIIMLLIFSFMILNIEHYFIVEKNHLARSYTCYFSLPFVVYFLMEFVLKMKEFHINFDYALGMQLRKMSTIYYCAHASIAYVLLEHGYIENNKILFLVTWCLSTIVSYIIFSLEKNKYCSWLKYSH